MNAKITGALARLRHDQRGLTTVEYAIVLCLIAAVGVGTWQTFGSELKTRLTESSGKINNSLQTADAEK